VNLEGDPGDPFEGRSSARKFSPIYLPVPAAAAAGKSFSPVLEEAGMIHLGMVPGMPQRRRMN